MKSLAGLRVAVTRPEAGSPTDHLTPLVRAAGAEPVPMALTMILGARDPGPLVDAVERLDGYDWIVFTSGRAVSPFVDSLAVSRHNPGSLDRLGVRVCAVGPRTKSALLDAGITPRLTPSRFNAEGVVDALVAVGSPERLRILFPRAEEGRDVIPKGLREKGAVVDVVPAYRSEPDRAAAERLTKMVRDNAVDVLTFTAGSAASAFIESWRDLAGARFGPPDVAVIALGPSTAAVLRKAGWHVHRIADPHTYEGLIEAIGDWASEDGRDGTSGTVIA